MIKKIIILLIILISGLSCRKFVWDNPNDTNPISEPASLKDGLVAYYPFNGNANDESGNGNNGVVNGALLSLDRFEVAEKAFIFDGMQNRIIISNSISFNFQQNNRYSISYWMRPKSLLRNINQIIIDKQFSEGNGQIGWNSTIEPNGKLNFYVHNGNGNLTGSNFGDVSKDTWYHVVQIWNKGSASTYLNGVLVGTSNYSDFVGDNLEPLIIGNSDFGPIGTGFNGLLDDIRIYNRILTLSEITYLVNN